MPNIEPGVRTPGKSARWRNPLLIALILAAGMFIGAKLNKSYQLSPDPVDPRAKFDEVLRRIKQDYVDTPNLSALVDKGIESMLQELDPHSVYIPASELQAANEDLEGSFDGIGIEFNLLKDTIMVVSPIPGGPSDEVGLTSGDRIITIDGKNAAGAKFTNDDVVKRLRGKAGTKVVLGIKRDGGSKLLSFTVTRGKIPLYSVDAFYMLTPTVGYIKINRFAQNTLKEYNDAFGSLRQKGLQHLVLDLRGNPGGYLRAAVELSDQFLGEKELIVYTQGRNRKRDTYLASSIGGFETGKLVILVDEGSASASEIVSGAVQDQDRGLIVGRRTFGKGLVQEPIPLSDGSQLRLTVARYYTPSGRSIQRSYSAGSEAYYEELSGRFTKGELTSKDSFKVADSLKFQTLKGRTVYGGGGIVPDLFVSIDTLQNTTYLRTVISKGLVREFTDQYLDRRRKNMTSTYPNIDAFVKNFSVENPNLLSEFVSFATSKGVASNDKEIALSKVFLQTQLSALIARVLFRSEGYYRVINTSSPDIAQALRAIGDNTFQEAGIRVE